MTIHTAFPVREFEKRLRNAEECAEQNPCPVMMCKSATQAVERAMDEIADAFRQHGFKVPNDDRAREQAAMLYAYLVAGNPDVEAELVRGEAIGEETCPHGCPPGACMKAQPNAKWGTQYPQDCPRRPKYPDPVL